MHALNWKPPCDKKLNLCDCMTCVEVLLLQVCIQGFTNKDMMRAYTAKEWRELCFIAAWILSHWYFLQKNKQNSVISSSLLCKVENVLSVQVRIMWFCEICVAFINEEICEWMAL